jgi:hypothetical protein
LARGVKQFPACRCRSKPRCGSGPAGESDSMETQRVQAEAGTLEELSAADPGPRPVRRPRPPGPDTCHQFVRRQLAKALPELILGFLKRAQEGDLPAMKLLWQLAELDKQTEVSGEQGKDRKFVRKALEKYRQR